MKRILVGLDASPRAPFVLTAAADLARRIEGRLVLLRAIGVPPEVPVDAYRTSATVSLQEVLEQAALRDLRDLAQRAPDLVDDLIVDVGNAWQVVCDRGRALDADLIVIGSHGFGLVDRILGTTAARIVNHADRSVLVVRPNPSDVVDEAPAHH